MADDPVITRFLRDKYATFAGSGLAESYRNTLWADYMAAGEQMLSLSRITSTTMEGSSATFVVAGNARENTMAFQATIDSILAASGTPDSSLGHFLDRSCRPTRT